MAISDSTANTMSDWYTNSLATASGTPAAAANTGTVFGGTTPAASATTSSTGAAASNKPLSGQNVTEWYKNIAGREGEQEGLDYWNNQLASGRSSEDVYKDFVQGTIANNDFNPVLPSKKPTLLDPSTLNYRSVGSDQTVAGQLGGLLDANSNYIQSARDRAMRASNARGLSNSSIAASAGEDSAYQAALPIATSDAQAFREADAYNASLYNQGLMYNADAENAFLQQNNQITADKNTQMSIAQLQAATSKYQADKNEATSKYNTDAATKQQADQNKTTLVNNIIQTADLSPDRKAELLKQLGEAGLAAAIYVASDIAGELDTSNMDFTNRQANGGFG